MRRSVETIAGHAASAAIAALLVALALAGCGSAAGSSAPGAASTAPRVTSRAIPLSSTAITNGKLSAVYTCDGENIAPPLKWGPVLTGVHELVLFALGVPARRSSHTKDTVEWAMAGVNPEWHELGPGSLPTGAFLVEASNGRRQYSICPPHGQTRRYRFVVYAVPELIQVTRKINGAKLLANLAEGPPNFRAPAQGELTATYRRR
jgi:phosphatidylethanolamine-binding protein (PEBP) family uncharacterized protein